MLFPSLGVWSQGPGSHQWPVRSCKRNLGPDIQASTKAGPSSNNARVLKGAPRQPEAGKCPLGSLAHSSHQIYSQPLATSVELLVDVPLPKASVPSRRATLTHQTAVEILFVCLCVHMGPHLQHKGESLKAGGLKAGGPGPSRKNPDGLGAGWEGEQSGLRLPPSGHPENDRRASLPSNQAVWTKAHLPWSLGRRSPHSSAPHLYLDVEFNKLEEMISNIDLVPKGCHMLSHSNNVSINMSCKNDCVLLCDSDTINIIVNIVM